MRGRLLFDRPGTVSRHVCGNWLFHCSLKVLALQLYFTVLAAAGMPQVKLEASSMLPDPFQIATLG